MEPPQPAVGGATGDYGGNHGDTSPGSTGSENDYYFPGNGTGIINTCRGICDANGVLTGEWADKVAISDVRDGTSSTLLAGEIHIPKDSYNLAPLNGAILDGQELESHTRVGGPGAPLLADTLPAGAIFGFGSSHPGTTNLVFADGSSRPFRNNLDTLVLGRLCHRADGELVDEN